MNSSITNQLSDLTPASLAMLEECSAESIYAPGYIQGCGMLLALEEPDLKIVRASENTEYFLGVSAKSLLGQPLQRIFSRTQVKQMTEALLQNNLDCCNPFELKTRTKTRFFTPSNWEIDRQKPSESRDLGNTGAKSQTFRGTLHRTPDALILELEPQLSTERIHSIQFYHRLQASILALRGATSLLDLGQILAREIKTMTGFDRVMVYRFEVDDHGVVIAEEKAGHLESYLGLHYPAIDIPMPARRLFLRNWVRQIPNVNARPVHLICSEDASTQPPLDLSDCVLRGVSPYHIEYLQNMGVAGSLTISLIDGERLWGLIACHHYTPCLVDYETRKTCELLGQFASIELLHQQERELSHYRMQVKSIQDSLQQALLQEPNFIQQVLIRHATDLLNLVHAEGVAIALDQQITLVGQTPPLAAVQDLLAWLPRLNQPEIYLTNCLVRPYSPARAFKQVASGILVISILLHQKAYHLLWFRAEQIQTVSWAGNPQNAIAIDELGKLHLCPRKSFELWKETVQETSLPWEMPEIEAARMMRNTLMLAVLEFSQTALEQAAERAAIANRAKSQFLAKMSHELRTPLNAILGFAQVMNRNPHTPTEFQEHLGIISRSGEYLLALINDVLEMSRIEAGQLVLTERHFNLHRLLQSIQELFALKAAQKGLTLSFERDQSVPRYVCSDESKLRQILINLISNAIKFTTQGSVTVRVKATEAGMTKPHGCTCYPDSPPPCHALTLNLTVEDTGCGIDTRDWESVFEAFMQTEQGRHAEGTGLGLSISRQFARLMGGDITVQSTVNQGSSFTCQVRLYQPKSIDLLEPETEHLVIGLKEGQPPYRILVVEDFPENRQLLQALLEPIGFEIRVVENGAEAIAQWKAWQPHLILMDIQMPVMDGYEATRQIRLLERHASLVEYSKLAAPDKELTTKIVALTAYAFEDDRIACIEAGCDGYITKPFIETVLFETIARHLGAQYCYADNSPPASASLERESLTAQDLSIMPSDWITQVHEAALDLNDGKIRQLIAEIPQQAQMLIEQMSFLVDNFQLEAIATLTQEQGEKT